MKLSIWAKKQGISYITAWRWFNEGRLPVKAYRSDSGTIIVQDESESSEQVMGNTQSNDVMSMVLKKTVEFSKSGGTVEDFAAWVLSTFSLKLSTGMDSPKYSRIKPKPEDVQKHFQQFMKKGEKPKPNAIALSNEALNEIVRSDGLDNEGKISSSLELSENTTFSTSTNTELNDSFSELFVSPNSNITTYNSNTGGIVMRSVDSTPQLNYTGSSNAALGTNFVSTLSNVGPYPTSASAPQYFAGQTLTAPITNNVLWVNDDSTLLTEDSVKTPAKRGRKPAKSFGRK